MSDEAPTAANSPFRLWRLRIAAVLLILVVLLHAPLLRGVSGLLVVDAPHATGDLLALENGSEALAAVANIYNTRGRFDHVLIIPDKPRHTDELGITESSVDEIRAELTARGVPAARILVVGEPSNATRSRVAAAGRYLHEHPQLNLTLVVSRYEGRTVQCLIDAELAVDDRPRIALASEPSPAFDERRWWTTRWAVQSVFRGYLRWCNAAWGDEAAADAGEPIDWTAYEAAIARGVKP